MAYLSVKIKFFKKIKHICCNYIHLYYRLIFFLKKTFFLRFYMQNNFFVELSNFAVFCVSVFCEFSTTETETVRSFGGTSCNLRSLIISSCNRISTETCRQRIGHSPSQCLKSRHLLRRKMQYKFTSQTGLICVSDGTNLRLRRNTFITQNCVYNEHTSHV